MKTVAYGQERVVYDRGKVKDVVAVLAPAQRKIYFALYAKPLSSFQKETIRRTQQLDVISDGSSNKVIAYIQLKLKPETKSMNLSSVVTYTMEFMRDESWKVDSNGASNINWSAPMSDNAPDLSAIKSFAGTYDIGESTSLVTSGEQTFRNGLPTFVWDLDLTADILFSWNF